MAWQPDGSFYVADGLCQHATFVPAATVTTDCVVVCGFSRRMASLGVKLISTEYPLAIELPVLVTIPVAVKTWPRREVAGTRLRVMSGGSVAAPGSDDSASRLRLVEFGLRNEALRRTSLNRPSPAPKTALALVEPSARIDDHRCAFVYRRRP